VQAKENGILQTASKLIISKRTDNKEE